MTGITPAIAAKREFEDEFDEATRNLSLETKERIQSGELTDTERASSAVQNAAAVWSRRPQGFYAEDELRKHSATYAPFVDEESDHESRSA